MSEIICKKLEAFLCGELLGPAEKQFEAHLVDCERCRREVDAAKRIDDLVRHAGRMAHPRPNWVAGVAATFRSRTTWRHPMPGWAAAALALAVVLCLAAWNLRSRDRARAPVLAQQRVRSHATPAHSDSNSAFTKVAPPPIEVRVNDYLALAQNTGDANVTVVLLYPIVFESQAAE